MQQPQNELTILDFHRMFSDARSMAIVGSSSSVHDWSNGDYIESHDVVVRFNRAHTEGQERHVGSRTDIVVANEGNNLRKGPSPENTVRPRCVVSYIRTPCLKKHNTRWKQPFFEWLASTPLFLCPSPEIFCCDIPQRRRGFSMGTYALASLPHFLSIEKLFVTGFTMFGSVAGGTHHYCKPPSVGAVTWHDAELERHVFGHLLGSLKCELTVTDEVAHIMEDQGYPAQRLHETTKSIQLPGPSLSLRPAWYLVERAAKVLLVTGFGLRRIAERYI